MTHSSSSYLELPGQTSTCPPASPRKPARRAGCRLLAALVLGTPLFLQADPVNGLVVGGQGTIVQAGATTTVTQSTPNLSLTWGSFNIGAHETVNFVQPSASALAVNRILDVNGTQILGRLNANGQVYLINPNGILFGQGAQVNVGGLVSSTLGFSEADRGDTAHTFRGPGSGRVVNHGTITAASGGYVALLGHQVGNQGVITTPLGTTALAAGGVVTLNFNGNSLVRLQVDAGVLNTLAENGGLIRADGGLVVMSAGARDSLLASVVNHSGVISARTVENRNGTVLLLGGQAAGTVLASGVIEATGTGAGQRGGTVHLLAGQVGVLDQADLNVSGAAGGGTVLAGGDFQGTNAAVPNARATYLGAEATIRADALASGSGGKIILWGDESTRAYGRLSARGGAQGGDGGLIETSGHALDVTGLRADASAPNGRRGSWLLDPADVTISGAITSGGVFGGGNPNIFAPNSAVAAANVDVATLVVALGTTDVTIMSANTGTSGAGTGNITVSSAITWTAPTVLTFNAVGNVNVNQAITGTDGSFIATAGGSVNMAAAFTTTTGNASLTALDNVNLNAAMSVTTGSISAIAANNVNVTGALTVTTGNIVLRADNDGTSTGGAALGGTVSITGTGGMTITTGVANIRFNPAGYANTDAEILAYGLKLTGTGTMDARAWVFATAANKVYNGTTAATAAFRGDPTVGATKVVNLNGGTIAFADRNAGAAKTVNFNGFTISGADANDYELFAGTGTSTATISQAPLSVTAQTDTKVYNGTTASAVVPLVTAGSLQTGDTTTTFLQTFNTANAGVGKTLTPSGIVNDGNSGANYAYTFITNNTGAITPAPVNLSGNRVYDGSANIAAGVLSVGGLVGGETLLLTGTGSVTNRNVGLAKPLTLGTLALGNGTGQASNYTFTGGTHTAGITQALMTVTAQTDTKGYDATTTSTVLPLITSGALQAGDTTTTFAQSFNNANAGVGKTLTPSGIVNDGNSGANYAYTFVGNNTGVITPRAVNLSGNRTYDGTANIAAGMLTIGSLVGGETLSLTGTGSVASRNAGLAKPLTLGTLALGNGTGQASNYTFTGGSQTAGITQALMTVTAQTATKTFDGTTGSAVLPLITSGALQAGDTTTTFAQTYDNANAGVGKTLTPAGIVNDGNSGANYAYTFVNSNTGVITAAPVTVTGVTITGTVANNKVYDGTTLGTFSNIGFVTTGVGLETLVLNGPLAANINFNTKDVATANLVTGTGYSLSNGTGGGLASNYVLTSTSASAPASITPRSVNLTGNRTYDGSANIGAGMLTIGSLVGTETLALTGTGSVASRNVGLAKPLTLGSLALANGTGQAANYTFTGGTRTAGITQAGLTLSTLDVVKVFDGNVSALGTAVATGGTLFAGDTLSGGTFAYTSPAIGLGNKTVTIAGVTVADGNGGANYLVSYANNLTSSITIPGTPASFLSLYASLHQVGLSLSPSITVLDRYYPTPVAREDAFALESRNGIAVNATMNRNRFGPTLEIVDPGVPDQSLTRKPRNFALRSTY